MSREKGRADSWPESSVSRFESISLCRGRGRGREGGREGGGEGGRGEGGREGRK